ncbi:interferon-induced 44-like protein [Labeo rohita]|uniref:Interferon-induced 44-like protein n=1 Tax=Labeo rohita TaxID=84645 RepID=A0A498LE99_LABRO|nr:interferon-induced 44-like protein [Labeo rohita]
MSWAEDALWRLRQDGRELERVLLHGPVGAGKSSFFNSVNTALQGCITTKALADATTGKSFTNKCKTYKVKKDRPGSYFPFTFTDIAGMHDEIESIKTDDIIKLLNGHISDEMDKPWRLINWKEEEKQTHLKTLNNFQSGNPMVSTLRILLLGPVGAGKSSFFNSVNTVLQGRMTTRALADSESYRSFTMECKDFRLKKKDNSSYPFMFTDIKGIEPEERKGVHPEDLAKILLGHIKNGYRMEECSSRLGVPVTCIFPVKNYHEEDATNTKMDILILKALLNIVNFANDYVQDQADNE